MAIDPQLQRIFRLRGSLVDLDLNAGSFPKFRLKIYELLPNENLVTEKYDSGDVLTTTATVRKKLGVYTLTDAQITAAASVLSTGHLYRFKWWWTYKTNEYCDEVDEVRGGEQRFDTDDIHKYTYADLVTTIRRKLGADPGAASYQEIINDAILRVVGDHEWSWAMADSADLDVVEGLVTVKLPTDFMRLRSINIKDNINGRCVHATLQQISDLANKSTVASTDTIYYAITTNPGRTASSVTSHRMHIYPTPEETIPSYLTIHYERIPPKIGESTDVPAVPPGIFPLVRQACCMIASTYENDPDAQAEEVRYANALASAAAIDGRNGNPHLGPIGSCGAYYEKNDGFPLDPDGKPTL